MSDPVRRLASQIAQLRARVDGLGSGPQLAFSSIEGGAIDEYDNDGNHVGSIGEQFDGTHGAFSLSGPPPPTPSAPTAEGGTTGTLGWDGVFVNDAGEPDITIPAPMDHSRVEIHMSQDPNYLAETADTLVDSIESPRGGTRPVLPAPGIWYAVLVARSLSGKRSVLQSAATRFEILPSITEEEIQAIRDDFAGVADGLAEDLRQNTIAQGGLADRLTNLQEEVLPALELELGAAGDRLDAADNLLNVTFPKRISDAEKAAAAATSAVENLVINGAQLIKNGDFELGDVHWQKTAAWAITAAAARGGSKFGMRVTPATANAWPQAERIPTEKGRVYRLEMWVRRTGTDTWSTQSIGFVAQTRDGAGAYSTPVVRAKLAGSDAELKAGDIPTDDFVKVQADVTINQVDARTVVFAPWFYVSTANTYDIDDVRAVDITLASEAITVAGQANVKAAAAEAAAVKAAADLVTAKARADTAATAATTAAAEAAAAEASSARATGAAGVAEAAADKSRQDAAAALTQAQNAGGNVATAQAAAAAAQTAADASKASATTAGTAAANADAKAAQAAADAAKAAADALLAQQNATKSAGEATAAKTSASTAASKATAAETAAATAASKATTAATDATAAAAKAALAETSATKATGAAGVAETAADNARIAAAASLTQAQNSGSNATAAQAAANAAKTASDTAAAASTKAGTAAAAADAAAAKAAADAAQAAADLIIAKNAAADARGDADTAIDRADAAITAAGSAARVLYSTAAPSGTAREGDTWRQTNGTAGDIIGEWRYTKVGTAAASWKPQKVTGEMVSNLDVGKLTVGTGAFTTAVAEKMAAQTATIQKADVGNLTVTETSNLNNVVAERISAKIGEFVEVYASKIVADAANFKTGVAEKFAAGVGSFVRLYASQVFIGDGGNILPDPGFRDADTNAGRMTRSTGTWTLVPGTATEPAAMRHVMSGTNDAFQYWPNTPTTARGNEMITVFPGQVFRLAVDVTTTAAGVCRWNAYLLKADGSVSYVGLTSNASATGRRPVEQDYTIPAGVVGVAFAVACLTGTAGTFTVHGNGSVREKVTPALVVDGLVSGQNIIGAMIQTQAAANRGVKITDAGMFAYSSTGVETLRFDGANSIITGAVYRTSTSGARVQLDSTGLAAWNASNAEVFRINNGSVSMVGTLTANGVTQATTVPAKPSVPISLSLSPSMPLWVAGAPGSIRVPGLQWLSDNSVTPPQIYSTSGTGLSISSGVSGNANTSDISMYDGMMNVSSTTGILLTSNKGDIDIRTSIGAVRINGYVYGESEIRERVTIASTWTHWTDSGWNGLWVEQMGKLTIISGAVGRTAAWGNAAVVATLPARYRPFAQMAGAGCEVLPTGVLRIPAGSTAVSFSITYFAA